jgi:hypothetical protein
VTAQPAVARSAGPPDSTVAVANLVRFLETGSAPEGLFTSDVFADLSLPHWRVQTNSEAAILVVRAQSHPFPGRVRVERVEATERGFTIEFEERWEHDGQSWYSREMIRADLDGDSIAEMSIYCTGDWDEARQREHARMVHLLRK